MRPNQKYCNASEIAELLGKPVKTVYDWASKGIIPSYQPERSLIFDPVEVDEAIRKFKRETFNPEQVARSIADEIEDV
jgi:excisionase family DNA binding protein